MMIWMYVYYTDDNHMMNILDIKNAWLPNTAEESVSI